MLTRPGPNGWRRVFRPARVLALKRVPNNQHPHVRLPGARAVPWRFRGLSNSFSDSRWRHATRAACEFS